MQATQAPPPPAPHAAPAPHAPAAPARPAPRPFSELPRGTRRGERADRGRWKRRAISLPLVFLAATLAAALFPVLLPLAFLVDLVRGKRFALSRCVLFFSAYLVVESLYILLCGLQWLVAPGFTKAGQARLLRWIHPVGRGWGRFLDHFGRWCFSVELDVTGRESLTAPGPIITFLRHASVADNTFAPSIIAAEHGYDLRYVAKHEVQYDPVFDIIGNRLLSSFVRRGSDDPEREVAVVTAQLENLGSRDAIVIWPEGTRFSAGKRERILASIERRGDAAQIARARALKNVLPVHTGGPVALLDEAIARGIEVDVVFCLSAGYEGAATFADLVQGRAIGRTVRVHFERVSSKDLPRGGREALADWLMARWERVDAWVGAELPKVLARQH